MTAPSRSASDSDLVNVVYAHDQTEAVFVQGLLHDADAGSVLRRAPGFDVPESCRRSASRARRPRPSSPSRETSCARVTRMRRATDAASADRPSGCSPGC